MNRPTFTILIPTTSRPTLATRTLRSLRGQLLPGDEVLLVAGGTPAERAPALTMFRAAHLPGRIVELPTRGGDWGHTERNLTMHLATTTHLMHIDDDDEYAPGALAVVRAAVTAEPTRPHIFRFIDRGGRWPDESRKNGELVAVGNVGTPCLVHPVNLRRKFKPMRGGDGHFIVDSCKLCPAGPVVHEDVIVWVNGTRPAKSA